MGKHKIHLGSDELEDYASPSELAWAREVFYSRSAGTMTLIEIIDFAREWDKQVRRLNPRFWRNK